jgi:hypothetical protein
MKVVIQVAPRDDAKAWSLLQRHSPGVALPNQTFVVSPAAAEELRKQRIDFVVLSDDSAPLLGQGAAAGERI